MRALVSVPLLALLLAACSGGLVELPNSGDAPDLFYLGSISGTVDGAPKQVIVQRPLARAGLNSDRIARRDGTNQLAYLAAARWAESLPDMVQHLLIESFDNHGWYAVDQRQVTGRAERLQLDIWAFQVDYAAGGQAVIKLRATLGGGADVRHRTFTARAPASGDTSSAVRGFDEAFAQIQADLVAWIANTDA